MKKEIISVLSILLSCATFAQYNIRIDTNSAVENLQTTVVEINQPQQKVDNGKVIQMENQDFYKVESAKSLKASSALPISFYGRPKGTYVTGLTSKGGTFYPSYTGHGCTDWKFMNYSANASSFSWEANGSVFSTDTNAIMQPKIGFYYMPKLTTTNNSGSSSYTFGAAKSSQVIFAGKAFLPATTAQYYTDSTTNNADFYIVNGGNFGNYGFGSGLTIPDISTSASNAIYSFYEKPIAPMYVDTVYAYIYSKSGTPFPVDGKINLYLLKLGADGKVTTDTIAKSTCSKSDLIKLSTYIYTMPFTFKDVDEFGFETLKGIVLGDTFVVKIEGFSATGFDFGFMSDYHNPVESTAAFDINGNMYTWKRKYNFFIHLNAAFTTLYASELNRNVTAPAAGGLAVDAESYITSLYSTFLPVDDNNNVIWEITKPDWVTVNYDSTYYRDYSIVGVAVEAVALPDGVDSRNDVVTIACRGAKTTIYVNQTNGTGILNVAGEELTISKQSENIIVSYPAGYTQIAIYSVNGQLILSSELNNSGKFTFSKNSLEKGIYVVKTLGSKNTKSVKLIN